MLLVAAAEADEPVSPPNDRCGYSDQVAEPERAAERKLSTGRKISLDFKDADIVNVLRMLTEIGREDIVITDDVKGRVTLRLVDVSWDQAFDIVLQTNRLGCVKIDDTRRVSTIRASNSVE